MIKFLDILKESDDNIFIPRRTKEEKDKKLLFRTYRKIRDYIKNGSQGDLVLHGSPIEFLPKNLTQVNGDLILDECVNLKSLPDNLTVNSDLVSMGCKNLKSLPSGLKVKGNLDLRDTNITELPPDLEFGKSIILMRTPIEKLPENLKVDGRLDLDGSKNITSLPSGLKVKDDLDLRDTNITELPPDLQFERSIYLQRTPIKKLPNNLTIDGRLELGGCKNITSLPSGLSVESTLDITASNITELPPDLKVGSIILVNTPLSRNYSRDQIRKMISHIRGGVFL